MIGCGVIFTQDETATDHGPTTAKELVQSINERFSSSKVRASDTTILRKYSSKLVN